MEQLISGSFMPQEHSIAIVASRFNTCITSKLLEGAKDCLYRHGLSKEQLHTVWVPGAFELPLIAKKLAESGHYQAIICLGAVIRGETSHFDYVCAQTAKGIASVSLSTDIPILFGVLTTETLEQAINRAGAKHGNKGWEVALAALEMCNLMSELDNREKKGIRSTHEAPYAQRTSDCI